jgi:hypothetical protein
MSSAETDKADRRERERQIDQALAADRAGRDRLRARADQQAPERDQHSTGTPNTGGRS